MEENSLKERLISIYRNRYFRLGLAISGLLFLFGVIALSVFVLKDLPDEEELHNLHKAEASEIYSSDKVLLGKYYIEDRTNVSYDKLPEHLINALIATEDVRFYQHNGIDKRGWVRVLVKSVLLHEESSGGGSTLSQQLAKNMFPRKNYMVLSMAINKLREAIIATRMEDIFTKKEILTLYLNTVPFGENAYGIEAGARRFFNRPVEKLKTEEAAVLVGMLKANTYYNPRKNPERALSRRNVVLYQMAHYDYLPLHKYDSLKNLPLKLNYNFQDHNEGLATYFRENLRKEVQEICKNKYKKDGTPYNIYTDGLKIYTTINSKLQKHAEAAVLEHMTALQKSFYQHWKGKAPWAGNKEVLSDAQKRTDRYKSLTAQGLDDEAIRKSFNTPVDMKIFSYKGEKEKSLSPLDSIRYYLYFLHTGFVAMEPNSGYIKAWVGGINHKYFKYDHVNYHAKRQAGSTFKPIVYAAALEQGLNPCEYYPNRIETYAEYNNWSPKNSDGVYGGYYSMTGALTNSVNTVSAQLIMKAGISNVINLASRLGIKTEIEPVPSIALGAQDVSLMEMVNAYSVFANGGMSVDPVYLLKITDKEGNTIYEKPKSNHERVIREQTAEAITMMLKSVVENGTASRLKYMFGLNQEIAGKTGTTQSHADGWFIGYTPKLVAGCWVGAEDRRIHFRSIELGQGASMALPIFAKFFQKVGHDKKLSSYYTESFPPVSEETATLMDCQPYVETADDSMQIVGNEEEQYHENKDYYEEEKVEEPIKTWFKGLFKKKRRGE